MSKSSPLIDLAIAAFGGAAASLGAGLLVRAGVRPAVAAAGATAAGGLAAAFGRGHVRTFGAGAAAAGAGQLAILAIHHAAPRNASLADAFAERFNAEMETIALEAEPANEVDHDELDTGARNGATEREASMDYWDRTVAQDHVEGPTGDGYLALDLVDDVEFLDSGVGYRDGVLPATAPMWSGGL